MITTIIIDDEPWAIDVLTMLLKKKCSQDVQVVATSNSPTLGNAIWHGLSHKEDNKQLQIRIYREKTRLDANIWTMTGEVANPIAALKTNGTLTGYYYVPFTFTLTALP
jgi:hypothetical protein